MKKLIFFSVAIIFISCNEELIKYPLTAPSTETFLKTENELKAALVGCMNPLTLRFGENPYPIWFEMYSDIAANRDTRPEDYWNNPAAGNVTTIWRTAYTGISRCNFLLNNFDRARNNVSEATILNIEAQAKFLRAYYYFMLSEFYGGVPLVTDNLELSESYLTRSSKEDITTFILKELNDASTNLTITNQPNTMTISKGAAWALASRVALYNGRWQEAIIAAQKVMELEGSEYLLHPNYEEICLRKGKTSKEIIWAIQFNYNDIYHETPLSFRSRMASGYINRIPVQALVDSYDCIDGLPIDKSPLYNPVKPFENRDPRLGKTIALPGSIYYGYQFETHKDSIYCWNYNVTPPKRVSNLDATHTYASFSGYGWRKYADPTEEHATRSDINPIIMRYAEVLLNYVEAKIESNSLDESVYTAINKVRRRAGMPDISPGKTQTELRSIVRKERKVEFAGEGIRYYDILRWKIAEQVLNGPCYGRIPRGYLASAPAIDANGTPDYSKVSNASAMRVIQARNFDKTKNYLWPIPTIELQTNPNLEQNPGY